MLFLLNALELSGYLNTPNEIYEALNRTEMESWKKSAIAEVNNFLKRKYLLIQSKERYYKQGEIQLELNGC